MPSFSESVQRSYGEIPAADVDAFVVDVLEAAAGALEGGADVPAGASNNTDILPPAFALKDDVSVPSIGR